MAAAQMASSVTIVIDGSPVTLDQPAVISNGRILVPLRGVFLRLGAIVTWDPASQTVLAQRGTTTVSLTIGAPQAIVDGQPQALDAPATIIDGHTLVPLRFISQAFGAGVSWNAASSTVQITSQGSANQQQQPVVPYQPGPPPASVVQTTTGTVTQVIAYAYPGLLSIQTPDGAIYTYRIVSGTMITRVNPSTGFNGPVALNAIRPGDAVTVTADQTGTAEAVQALNYPAVQHQQPYVPAPPAVQTISGTVIQVNTTGYPEQLSVQTSNGVVYNFGIVVATSIWRTNRTTGFNASVPLGAVLAGDAVTVTADPSGTAQNVQAAFAEIKGTVAWVGRDRIRMNDGQIYRLDPNAQVAEVGQIVSPSALQPGAVVALRVNPDTRRVYGITLVQAAPIVQTTIVQAPPAPPVEVITAINVTRADRGFDEGDTITVTFQGPPHGRASFSIAGLRNGLLMTESPNQPGQYVGTYRVQPGDSADNAGVIVAITAPSGHVLTASAPVVVRIHATHRVPPQPANPAPVITSPTTGKGVTAPITVTGTVRPFSRVAVSVEYTQSAVGLPPRGTLGSVTVSADANGNWSATFGQASPAPVKGANLTITAVVVDRNGAVQSAPAVVTTTLATTLPNDTPER
jgi:hypothetical protein